MLRLLLAICLSLLAACNQGEWVKGEFRATDQTVLHKVQLEVVKTSLARAKGLMYRKKLANDSGMIFVFPDVAERGFWMKNTFIPLDMLFISEDLKVLGMLENVPILNEVDRRLPVKSKYVVELPAGTAQRTGIKVGSQLVLERKLSGES